MKPINCLVGWILGFFWALNEHGPKLNFNLFLRERESDDMDFLDNKIMIC